MLDVANCKKLARRGRNGHAKYRTQCKNMGRRK